ncbi:MAG: hypothetical protein H7Y42_14040, partial [Chitinophagaceae bacterium]|nr:hypothetical protein [Chitinophagaceae bacterium]
MKSTQKYVRPLSILLVVLHVFLVAVGQQLSPAPYSSDTRMNFVRTWNPVKPDSATSVLNDNTYPTVAKITTQYLDGWGRIVESVVRKGSMISNAESVDMVNASLYDDFGRESYKYLPFGANSTGGNASISDGLFKYNPFQQDSSFNKGIFSNEAYFYGKTVYEPSPLSRPQEIFAPGNSWSGTESQTLDSNRRSIKIKYWLNSVNDSVRVWNVTNISNSLGTYGSSSIYATGQLFKTVTIDENSKQVVEFKDKEGLVVLKKVQLTAAADTGVGLGHTGWLCTYYIYDASSNLRCVIQPKAVETLAISGWSLTSTILSELCFRYEYDERNRLIMKKTPGMGITYLVYDRRDRLVMKQDSLLRAAHKWSYILYDDLNRTNSTGLITDNTNYNNPVYHWGQAKISSAYPTPSSYTNEELTTTFYDDYTWRSTYSNPLSDTRNSSYDSYLLAASNSAWPFPQVLNQVNQSKGLITGSRSKVLGTSSTYLYSVNFYDDKARTIQVESQNVTGGTDVVATQFGWAGSSLITIVK